MTAVFPFLIPSIKNMDKLEELTFYRYYGVEIEKLKLIDCFYEDDFCKVVTELNCYQRYKL